MRWVTITGATPQPAGGGAVTLSGAATIAVAPGVTGPIAVTASETWPDGSGVETLAYVLYPGGGPATLPDPGAGNVWLVTANRVSRLEAVGAAWSVVGLAVWGIAGWQIGGWIGDAIERRRRGRMV